MKKKAKTQPDHNNTPAKIRIGNRIAKALQRIAHYGVGNCRIQKAEKGAIFNHLTLTTLTQLRIQDGNTLNVPESGGYVYLDDSHMRDEFSRTYELTPTPAIKTSSDENIAAVIARHVPAVEVLISTQALYSIANAACKMDWDMVRLSISFHEPSEDSTASASIRVQSQPGAYTRTPGMIIHAVARTGADAEISNEPDPLDSDGDNDRDLSGFDLAVL